MFISVPSHVGYGVLAALIAGESAGLPIPGETALISAALLTGPAGLSLPVVIGVAAGAAIVGDNIGYWFGRRAGRRALLAERGPFRRHRRHLMARGEVFFARHGVKAVVLGRFVAGVRVVAAVVAGATGMRAGAFLVANAVGAIGWAASTALLVSLLGSAGALIALVSGWALAGTGVLAGLIRIRRRRRVPVAALADDSAG